MSLTGIETLGDHRALEPRSAQPARSVTVDQFREIVEGIMDRLNARDLLKTDVSARAAAPGSNVSAAAPFLSTPTPMAHGLSTTGTSILLDPDQPRLDHLSADLVAGDAQYNEREVVLRERLDLATIERRLRESAAESGVDFHQSDLDGVLRNAGYDRAHLGSSERYVAAVESFIGEAENSYRLRSTNAPGSSA